MGKCTICVAKAKSLTSFAVTAKLICLFVFAYPGCWFSHEAAHFVFIIWAVVRLDEYITCIMIRTETYETCA